MIIIPAIDLKEGRCVRLLQGRMDRETVYSEDPVQMAKHWDSRGAERLHVVDLNGALTGRPVHDALIREIIKSVRIPVEVGGGIRDLETMERYLSMNVRWVILGTAAIQNPGLMEQAGRRFPGRVILSVDARCGKVAIQGWSEVVSSEAQDLVRQFDGMDLSAIIFTDIERDGMGTGINLASTGALAKSTSIPVIAAGGISRMEEIEQVLTLEPLGVIGVIVGRALYTGQIDLVEALRLEKERGTRC